MCTNGTLYNQKEFTCDWWYNVKCEEAINYYSLNADPEHNPFTPKKKIEEEHIDAQHYEHAEEHQIEQHQDQRQLHHRRQPKFLIQPY